MKESVTADIFSISNMPEICIVDYQSKFPFIKQVKGFSTDNLVKHFM